MQRLRNAVLVLFVSVVTLLNLQEATAEGEGGKPSPVGAAVSVSEAGVQVVDRDLQARLQALRSALSALHTTVDQLREGHSSHTRQQEEKTRTKLRRLASTIAQLSAANSKLVAENASLKAAKSGLAGRLSALEARAAEAADTSGGGSSADGTRLNKDGEKGKSKGNAEMGSSGRTRLATLAAEVAAEAEALLREGGLEHFASPRFSGFVAAVVSNGVLIAPLAAAAAVSLRSKSAAQMSGAVAGGGGAHMLGMSSATAGILARRMLRALLAFDAAFTTSLLASSVLVLGDPVAALRHISEANLALLQLVLAVVTAGAIAAALALVLNRKTLDRRRVASVVAAKAALAVPYVRRVWAPVMDGDDVEVGMPPWWYVAAPFVGWLCVRAVGDGITDGATGGSVTVGAGGFGGVSGGGATIVLDRRAD